MHVEKALDDFGRFVIQQARSRLTKAGKRDTNKLYNSLRHDVKKNPNSIELSISMEDYGDFVDKGVRGFSSSKKAPNSPYKFGTGTGKKGGLTKAINEWVPRQRFQFRDKKGKFLSFEQTAFTIRRSIWHKGIEVTEFYSKPFEQAFKRLPEAVVEAYGLDLDTLIKLAL